MSRLSVESECAVHRSECKALEVMVRALIKDSMFDDAEEYPGQHAEVRSNLMLAVRHLEDARMRLGKAIQYCRDGVSVFDKGQS